MCASPPAGEIMSGRQPAGGRIFVYPDTRMRGCVMPRSPAGDKGRLPWARDNRQSRRGAVASERRGFGELGREALGRREAKRWGLGAPERRDAGARLGPCFGCGLAGAPRANGRSEAGQTLESDRWMPRGSPAGSEAARMLGWQPAGGHIRVSGYTDLASSCARRGSVNRAGWIEPGVFLGTFLGSEVGGHQSGLPSRSGRSIPLAALHTRRFRSIRSLHGSPYSCIRIHGFGVFLRQAFYGRGKRVALRPTADI